MKIKQILSILFLIIVLPGTAIAEVNSDDWGLHRIWGKRSTDLNPDVKGGVITAEWKDVNPAPGEFDFSYFDGELSRFASIGKGATVAIRGKYKPDFLFDEVPYHPQQLQRGVDDPLGTLQYWHPTYEKRYRELIRAFAAYLNQSPNSSAVFSIRQNVNAIGTEHTIVAPENRSEDQWIVPQGVSFVPYSAANVRSYKLLVSQQYYDSFATNFLLLIRTTLLDDNVPSVVLQAIADGRVGLLHTSSVPEPLDKNVERKYNLHKRYGRDGSTRVYAEPYSLADRGDQLPAQWNYWRLLSDLHVGVTYISVYGTDIERKSDMEFQNAFKFVNTYAGYQTGSSASAAPGGWVALRDGDSFLKGDYTFLMKRMSGDANVPMAGVGPNWQRFGMWARKIRAGGTMRFQLDDRLANSMQTGNAIVRVTYYNSKSPKFDVVTPGNSLSVAGGGTGTWKTKDLVVPANEFSGNSGADITLNAGTDVIVHMVEVIRDGPVAAGAQTASPKSPKLISVD